MIVYSINGVPIRLPGERWMHIVSHHNEMAAYYFEVLEWRLLLSQNASLKGMRAS